MQLLESLQERFGAENVKNHLVFHENALGLVIIQPTHDRKVTLLCTTGLSNFTMPVNEVNKGYEHIELYMALPSYWDINDLTNPNFNWVNEWLMKLSNHIIEKNTFFAHGHTLATGNPPESLSTTMKQNYFLVHQPIAFEEQMKSVTINNKTVHFLAVTPIFSDEFDYKVSRGTIGLLKKMKSKGCNEILDDYRTSTVRKKYILF